MTDRELISKLNNLKIKPDHAWKERNREILLSQISGTEKSYKEKISEKLDIWSEVFVPFNIFHKLAVRPVMVTGLILASLFGGSIVSIQAAKNTKPGDSLYIAKIISEKTQLALTFNEKAKAKLGVEFAGNRARELRDVMNEEPDGNAKTQKVEKLTENFKKELTGAKDRLEKINNRETESLAKDTNAEKDSDSKIITGANMGKSENGIEISDSTGNGEKPKENLSNSDTPEMPGITGTTLKESVLENKATSTENIASSTESAVSDKGNNVSDSVQFLDDAQKLFEEADYAGAVDKLEEIKNFIEQSKNTSLSDSATSTGEKVEMSAN